MPLDLLDQILLYVKDAVYPRSIALSDWKIKESDLKDGFSLRVKDNLWNDFQVPSFWGGYDRTSWFRRRVVIPEEFSGKSVVLLLDLSDALAFVNGKPYQGIDVHHQEILLNEKTRTGDSYLIAIQAYSGRKKEVSYFNKAALAVYYSQAKELFHCLSALREIDRILAQGTSDSKEIRELIRRTLIYLKYYDPKSEEYPNAIDRALIFLKQALDEEVRTTIDGHVHLIAQSQIHLGSRSTFKETYRRSARTFSTVLRLIEQFPQMEFHQDQALLYSYAKHQYPDLYRQIKNHVKDGKWRIIGGTLVQHDSNLLSGESLIRQILHGKQFFQSEFNHESPIAWYPYVNGFPASLPQILLKSGFNYLLAAKFNLNDTSEPTYNTFFWEGIDGSKLLVHNPPFLVDGQLTSKRILDTWNSYLQQEDIPDVMLPYGFGENGGGPTKEQLLRSRLPVEMSDLPKIISSTPENFFGKVEALGDSVSTLKRELYLEKHRGIYTTQGWIKRDLRKSEIALYNAEVLSTIAMLNGKNTTSRHYPTKELTEAWTSLLQNQSTDIISGTAIYDTYADVKMEFDKIENIVFTTTENVFIALNRRPKKSSKEFVFTVFNTLGWERSAYVEISLKTKEKYFLVHDEEGNALEYQILGRNKGNTDLLCYVTGLLPFSYKTISIVPSHSKIESVSPWVISPRIIDGPLFKLRLDASGRLTSIYDKRLRKELLKPGERGNEFQTFADRPEEWEAWEIAADFASKRTELFKARPLKILNQGPIFASFLIKHRSSNGSKITQQIRLYHKLHRIDFVNYVRWSEKQVLLKVAFPMNLKSSTATYEIPMGAFARTMKPRSDADRAKYEVPAQQWADISDAKYGISLLNDCKYSYDARMGILRLSLIRSPHFAHDIDPAHSHDSRYTDQGDHQFSYALFPHKGDWRDGNTIQQAREFNTPPLILKNHFLQPFAPLIYSMPENFILSAVKKAEKDDDVVIRLYEGHGVATKGKIDLGYSILRASECDLMENVVNKLKPSKSQLQLKFGPFEIKTLKLKLKAKKRMQKKKER